MAASRPTGMPTSEGEQQRGAHQLDGRADALLEDVADWPLDRKTNSRDCRGATSPSQATYWTGQRLVEAQLGAAQGDVFLGAAGHVLRIDHHPHRIAGREADEDEAQHGDAEQHRAPRSGGGGRASGTSRAGRLRMSESRQAVPLAAIPEAVGQLAVRLEVLQLSWSTPRRLTARTARCTAPRRS